MKFRTPLILLLTGVLVFGFLFVLTSHRPVLGDPSSSGSGTGFSSLSSDSPGSTQASSPTAGDQPLGRFVESPTETMTLVLDPGHGGRDRGVTRRGRAEKDHTLSFARTLSQVMNREFPGIKTILTRDQDEFLSLKSRTQKANEVGGDLFVSLHVNHGASPRPTGLQFYTLSVRAAGSSPRLPEFDAVRSLQYEGYSGDQLKFTGWIPRQFRSAFYTPQSRRVVQRMIERLQEGGYRLEQPPHRRAPLWVLKDVLMPALMVELGYLRSSDDEGPPGRLRNPRSVAEALATAIDTFRRKSDS